MGFFLLFLRMDGTKKNSKGPFPQGGKHHAKHLRRSHRQHRHRPGGPAAPPGRAKEKAGGRKASPFPLPARPERQSPFFPLQSCSVRQKETLRGFAPAPHQVHCPWTLSAEVIGWFNGQFPAETWEIPAARRCRSGNDDCNIASWLRHRRTHGLGGVNAAGLMLKASGENEKSGGKIHFPIRLFYRFHCARGHISFRSPSFMRKQVCFVSLCIAGWVQGQCPCRRSTGGEEPPAPVRLRRPSIVP